MNTELTRLARTAAAAAVTSLLILKISKFIVQLRQSDALSRFNNARVEETEIKHYTPSRDLNTRKYFPYVSFNFRAFRHRQPAFHRTEGGNPSGGIPQATSFAKKEKEVGARWKP